MALALVASGILQSLPDMVRLGLLAVVGLVFLISLKDLFRLIWPSRREAMRRMERASAVVHRPLSSAEDTIAAEVLDPLSDAVWEEHQRRQLLALKDIRISPPRSAWSKFDPRALRVPVMLAALAAVLLGPGSVTSNLRDATRLTPAVAAVPLTLDAWLKPPAYTGKPPLLLSAPSMQEKIARGDDLLVPEQSVFTLRVSGAAAPAVKLLDRNEQPIIEASGLKTSTPQDGVLAAEMKLSEPVSIVVLDGDTELARYPISIIPDAAPTIAISKTPAGEQRGALVTEWLAKDDYGIKSVSGEIELADEQD